MGVSGNNVLITIDVEDANATGKVERVAVAFDEMGAAGAAAGVEASRGMDAVGEHALTSLDNVRLLRDDLGVRIPRAMEKVIASSQMLSGVIGGIGTGLVAMGAIEILTRVGEQVYSAYDKWVLMTQEIAAASDAVKLFGDMSSAAMEQQRASMEHFLEVTQGPKASLQFKADNILNQPVDLSQIYGNEKWKNAPEEIKAGFQRIAGTSIAPADLDMVIGKLEKYEKTQKQILTDAQLVPFRTGGVLEVSSNDLLKDQQRVDLGEGMIDALKNKRGAIVSELNSIYADLDRAKPGTEQDQQALEKQRQKLAEIVQLKNAAQDSELSGISLLEAQREHALNAFVSKYGKSRDAIDAINSQYNDKEMTLWEKQWQEANKAMSAATHAMDQAQGRGRGSIDYDLQNALQDAAQKQSDGFDPTAAEHLRVAAKTKANADILAAQQTFQQRVEQIGEKSDAYQQSGYVRLVAEAQRSIQRIEDEWQSLAAKVGATSDAGIDGQLEAAARVFDIQQNLSRDELQLHERTMAQINKEEQQAARMGLPEWQQSQQAILDSYMDRVQQVKSAEDQQLAYFKGNQDQIRRITQESSAQYVTAWSIAQAQMERDAEQSRDRLGSTLSDFFSNPSKYIEKRAMDTAFQMMANDMMSFFKRSGAGSNMMQWLFGMGPQMSTSTNPLTDIKSVFGLGGSTASTAGITLANAGTQLMSASSLQLAAGNALVGAAAAIDSAATAFALGGAGTSIPGGGINLLGGTGFGDAGFGFSGAGSTGLAGGSLSSADYSALVGEMGPNAGGGFSALGQTSGLSSVGGNAGKGLGAAGGAFTAGFGIYNAYENSDPLGGAISGAIGGAEIGALGGPVGMAIGAVVGGLAGMFAGIFGDHGRGKAEDYDKNTVQPGLAKYLHDYEAGRAGYNQVAREIDQLMSQAKTQTMGWGSGARDWYSGHIAPEISTALTSVHQQERGGRSLVTMSAAQYHTGGWVGDFGDFGLGAGEGFAKLLEDEYVVRPMAARAHGPLLEAINSNSVSYTRTPQPRLPASQTVSSVTVIVKALDSQDVAQWARRGGGRALAAAINQANRQYSGVGRG